MEEEEEEEEEQKGKARKMRKSAVRAEMIAFFFWFRVGPQTSASAPIRAEKTREGFRHFSARQGTNEVLGSNPTQPSNHKSGGLRLANRCPYVALTRESGQLTQEPNTHSSASA